MFEALVREIAERFGLGDKANDLLSALLGVMFDERIGGLAGLLATFRQQGLGDLFDSWLGSAHPAAVPIRQLESVLGSGTLSGIADRLGVARGTIVAAVATMLPKLIAALTPNGRLPHTIPAGVSRYLDLPGATAGRTTRRTGAVAASAAGLDWGRAKWPLLALVVLSLGWCALNRQPGIDEPSRSGGGAPAVPGRADAPLATPTPTRQPELSLANDAGTISYSGTVGASTDRTRITDLLDGAVGPEHVDGDVGIDTSVRPAVWLAALGDLLPVFAAAPGATLDFKGTTITLGGSLSGTQRATVAGTLKDLFAGYTLNGLEPPAATASDDSHALRNLVPGKYDAAELVRALNAMAIEFDADSATIQHASLAVLEAEARALKNAPAGTRIEIGGHTDAAGNAANDLKLSESRAKAVRGNLIDLGVPADMLTAKGYGDTRPAASDATAQGRAGKRRVEFTVIE